MLYPAKFEQDKKGLYSVTFRDIPEAITCGDDFEQAKFMAQDALITAMDFYFEDNRTVPMPSKAKKNEVMIKLPLSLTAKVLLLNEMINQKVNNAKLARLMNTTPQEVQRVTNLNHNTKIDTIANALGVLGKDLELSFI
ncbi:type II toxin-antitoxin system HicB family antitoxin [Pasteurella skyensis]|uniref:Type II toxin-antitoxin system HicB family antitoxin n=1 Tax=Phocoenobacter skyensis TaxID=97481 RepID=A0AAJ6NBD7_9PAST|nr:type II toxin-antitoxin system HicB family antitoxin [Pasteurella skyensis]MDP8173666.1 type II toxin-antitoxin system HicB family antitoxin [Pasteurella skyensis]MDP8178034.1 type II toxin-antitoxin system HicB family antitoxin [Pasteurella skyensis]